MELQNFQFETKEIRIVNGSDGQPRWVAKDVAEALGYSESSLGQMNNLLRNVPEEWRGHNPIMTPHGEQDMAVLTEQGLYFFLGRSDKPSALPFQKWIAGEVIPSIRRTGSFSLVPKTLSQALRLAADQAELIESQQALIESQKPAVAFVESFVEAKQTQPLRAVAKVLGIKERAFVTALINNKILYRLDGRLVPSADVMSRGFFELKEVVAQNGYATTQMRFTTSGVEWIARKVKEWEI